ncbi:MAG: ATP-dependent sacrificial sulfur transferase LarE [Lachnospiraceae bacterium]|nr:ATP-dependent sacrificial sulfur transferase LarE [Lachnospiraceae bacterium]
MEQNREAYEKLESLKTYLKELKSVAVAFSSGVDSTFLLKVAHDVLGDEVIAVTARSSFFPGRESKETIDFCKKEGIRQFFVDVKASDIEGFGQNPPNRCYICKKALFTGIKEIAARQNITVVAEGTNMDDGNDYRPGLTAIAELGIKSPLRHVQMTKKDIRILSKEMGLHTWDKPSFACLASRFVYGETITKEKLSMVERAEGLLLDMGFSQMRVRIHGQMARIEVLPKEFDRLMETENREKIIKCFRQYGFTYVTMDLSGYRMGSMNETLNC